MNVLPERKFTKSIQGQLLQQSKRREVRVFCVMAPSGWRTSSMGTTATAGQDGRALVSRLPPPVQQLSVLSALGGENERQLVAGQRPPQRRPQWPQPIRCGRSRMLARGPLMGDSGRSGRLLRPHCAGTGTQSPGRSHSSAPARPWAFRCEPAPPAPVIARWQAPSFAPCRRPLPLR